MSETESNPENKTDPDWYIPKADRGKENPRRFKIRPLAKIEMCDVWLAKDDEGEWRHTKRSVSALLHYGLMGWENVADGKFVPGDSAANAEHLDIGTLFELAQEIWRRSFLSEADRKN